jgi:hypothetical protein
MIDHKQFLTYKEHLEKRYRKLLERSDSHRFIDESISDVSAFKAMKINRKLNQIQYLNRELFNTLS